MRLLIGLICLVAAFAAHADSSTLRVGSQVLVVGDSAARVVELLGKPSYKSKGNATPRASGRGKTRKAARSETAGEHWQYRVGNRTVTVVVADGKVVTFRN